LVVTVFNSVDEIQKHRKQELKKNERVMKNDDFSNKIM